MSSPAPAPAPAPIPASHPAPHPRRNVPTRAALHPAVYALLAGCALWIVAVSAIVFANGPYAALQIAIVGAFAAAFLLTPLWLARQSRAPRETGSFADWLGSEFEILDGTIEAKTALVMILSAPVAAAAGVTLVSLVAYLAAAGAI